MTTFADDPTSSCEPVHAYVADSPATKPSAVTALDVSGVPSYGFEPLPAVSVSAFFAIDHATVFAPVKLPCPVSVSS